MNKILSIIIIIMVTVTMSRCGDVSDAISSGGSSGGITSQPVLTVEGTLSQKVTIDVGPYEGQPVFDPSNASAKLDKTATITLQEIYTVTIDVNNNNAITLTDTEGNSLADTYYVDSIDTSVNTVTLTTTAPTTTTTYIPTASNNILNIEDTTNSAIIEGYITHFDDSTLILTLTDSGTIKYTVTADSNRNVISIDDSTQIIDSYYIESINDSVITLTYARPATTTYIPTDNNNILSVEDGTNTIITGYITEVKTGPSTLTVSLNGESMSISYNPEDVEEELIIVFSRLTIDPTSGKLVITHSISDYSRGDPATDIEYVDGYLNTITVTEKDGSGNKTKVTVTEPNGTITETGYDANGNITQITVTEPNGTSTKTGYDANGNITQITVTEPNGTITETGYDANGNITQITVTEPNGNITVTDANGNITQETVTDANGNITLTDATGTQYACNEKTYMPIIAPEGLLNIDKNLSGNYCLAKDIDLSSISSFKTLGIFGGTFDGQDNTIDNLTINEPQERQIGLFARNVGMIKNLNITNINITGSYDIGSLAYYNSGTIKNVNVDGKIKAGGQRYYVGGLVGNNSNGTIEQCSADITIEASELSDVGGLVGYNQEGTIKESYTKGSVSGKTRVGGLIGLESPGSAGGGPIRNNYSTATVTGESSVGGLIGEIQANYTSVKIENSYATGSVTGNAGADVGGFVGKLDNSAANYDIIITNSYFDETSTAQVQGIGANSTIPQTVTGYSSSSSGTVQNNGADITESDFEGDPNNTDDDWDFNSIWEMNAGEWPTLKWQSP